MVCLFTRFSYRDHLVDFLPEGFEAIIPPEPRPKYKYDQEGEKCLPCTGRKLTDLLCIFTCFCMWSWPSIQFVAWDAMATAAQFSIRRGHCWLPLSLAPQTPVLLWMWLGNLSMPSRTEQSLKPCNRSWASLRIRQVRQITHVIYCSDALISRIALLFECSYGLFSMLLIYPLQLWSSCWIEHLLGALLEVDG